MAFIRRQVEKRLPLKEGEQKLSTEAAEMVFRGSYLFPAVITEVRQEANYSSETRDAYPYKINVVRTAKDGTKTFSANEIGGAKVYKHSSAATLTELTNSEILNRANRVERISRRIKLGISGAALLALGSVITVSALENNESNPAGGDSDLVQCGQIITGTEVLVPADQTDIAEAERLGKVVCSLDQHSYQVYGS